MTCEEFDRALEQLREEYVTATEEEGLTPEQWDSITNKYWQHETELWEAYKGHPYTKPRPRPH